MDLVSSFQTKSKQSKTISFDSGLWAGTECAIEILRNKQRNFSRVNYDSYSSTWEQEEG